MIDIHCHLLPGIDDGPATLDEALALAEHLVNDGVTHVVCTPHVFPGRFDNLLSSIAPAVQRLVATLIEAKVPLGIRWASEVRLCPEALDLLNLNELPFLGQMGGFNTLLLEMPDGQIPLGADRFISALLARRIRPVLAHPERNREVMQSPQRLEPLIAQGCLVQLTAGSLVGQFGQKAQDTARALLERDWCQAIASDAHNLSGRRSRMLDARAWLQSNFGQPLAEQLTWHGPLALCGHGA